MQFRNKKRYDDSNIVFLSFQKHDAYVYMISFMHLVKKQMRNTNNNNLVFHSVNKKLQLHTSFSARPRRNKERKE